MHRDDAWREVIRERMSGEIRFDELVIVVSKRQGVEDAGRTQLRVAFQQCLDSDAAPVPRP